MQFLKIHQPFMPRIMGILNVTPDSFSDGGQFNHIDAALQQVENMVAAGVDIIDVGGESTRPGAAPISIQEECDRVLPIIMALKQCFDTPISIDTRHAAIMRYAVEAGAQMINDVYALQGEGALQTAAALNVPVCLMHMQGEPQTMQRDPQYHDVVLDIKHFFDERIRACMQAGISQENIILDPGFGFGKTYQHNLQLLKGLHPLTQLGYPLLVGLSRKAWIGIATDKPASERIYGSLAAMLLAVQQGAHIVRVHDVGATKDALRVLQAVSTLD